MGFDEEEGEIDLDALATQQAAEAFPEQLEALRKVLLGIFSELRLLRYLKEIEVLVSDDRKKQYETKRRSARP